MQLAGAVSYLLRKHDDELGSLCVLLRHLLLLNGLGKL